MKIPLGSLRGVVSVLGVKENRPLFLVPLSLVTDYSKIDNMHPIDAKIEDTRWWELC